MQLANKNSKEKGLINLGTFTLHVAIGVRPRKIIKILIKAVWTSKVLFKLRK